jgi:hypothetical protein
MNPVPENSVAREFNPLFGHAVVADHFSFQLMV